MLALCEYLYQGQNTTLLRQIHISLARAEQGLSSDL